MLTHDQANRILAIRNAIRLLVEPKLRLDVGSRWVSANAERGMTSLAVDEKTLTLEWEYPNEKGELKLSQTLAVAEIADLFVATLPSGVVKCRSNS